jgi:acetyl-CoA carboxylase biotin carboxylase subunit
MITGIDIVEAQLRIAMGEPLGFTQADVRFAGHAVECRINAEDSGTMLPSPGEISLWQPPEGEGVRVDTHIHAAYVVPPHYDSLVAKFIAHGPDRAAAIARMKKALAGARIEGISTNIPLHRELMQDAAFRAGGTGIDYLESRMAR